MIKNLPAIWETWVQSLGYKEHLEEVLFIPTAVFLPGVLHGERTLAGYIPWDGKEFDTTEQIRHTRINKRVEREQVTGKGLTRTIF